MYCSAKCVAQRCFAKCALSDVHPAPIDEPECNNEDDFPLAQLVSDIPWIDYLTVDDNTTTTADIDDDWKAQLLAKAAGAELESVIEYIGIKEALVQVNHISDACYQAQITDYRLLMAGQTTPQSIPYVLLMLQICCS